MSRWTDLLNSFDEYSAAVDAHVEKAAALVDTMQRIDRTAQASRQALRVIEQKLAASDAELAKAEAELAALEAQGL